MMEMNFKVIRSYFNLIHNHIAENGFFFNVNRYFKDTVGHPIELHNYPYDDFWKVILSAPSWNQNHIHQLITQRSKKKDISIKNEIKNINKLSKKIQLI